MGWRTNVGLLVLVGGLATYLALDEPAADKGERDPNEMTRRLLPKGAWAARQIWIEARAGREPIILDLDPVNSRVTVSDPVRDEASLAMMKSILDAYQGALLAPGYTAAELAAEPRLLAETGVDQPRCQIEFRYADGSAVRVAFGHPGIRDTEVWVKVGDAVYRTDPALHRLLDKNPDELREHLLFTDTNIGAPQKVRFEKRVGLNRRVYRVEQVERQQFMLVEPVRARAARSAVQGFFTAIGSLHVKRFLSGAPQPFGSDDHDFRVVMQGDRGVETLDVRILQSGVYFGRLQRRNITFELDRRSLEALEPWLPKLRDRKFHHIAEQAILRFELDPGKGGTKTVFVRDADQGYRIEQPIRIRETNATPVGQLLHELTSLEARSFVDDPTVDTGLQDGGEYFTVRISTQREHGLDVALRIGKPAGDGLVYVRRADEAAVARIEQRVADVFRQPWTRFISLRVPPVSAPPFFCEAHVPGRAAPIITIQRDLRWLEQRPAGEPVENAAVGEFTEALRALRAEAVVAAASIGADARSVRVVLRGDQHAASGEVYRCVLTRQGDQVLLQPDGYPGIAYRLPAPMFRTLLAGWLDR